MQVEKEVQGIQDICPALSAHGLFYKESLRQAMVDDLTKCEKRDAPAKGAGYLRLGLLIFLQLIMAGELVVLLFKGEWQSAFLVVMIMTITLGPIIFRERIKINIPPEFQMLVIVFVFASLFLGEVRGYYLRIWWWDIALHAGSGLLLGIFGFLLVYVLNENSRINVYLHIRFVALFAFLFAVAVGAMWEIFEFSMDRILGLNMQKPMLGDTSGLTDTMWDLIVDTLGAAAISLLGWWYMKRHECSFIDKWIQWFIDKNPRLFPS